MYSLQLQCISQLSQEQPREVMPGAELVAQLVRRRGARVWGDGVRGRRGGHGAARGAPRGQVQGHVVLVGTDYAEERDLFKVSFGYTPCPSSVDFTYGAGCAYTGAGCAYTGARFQGAPVGQVGQNVRVVFATKKLTYFLVKYFITNLKYVTN